MNQEANPPFVYQPNPGTEGGWDPNETIHHQSQRQKRKKQTVGAGNMNLNLTSMIDVVFQLLIYFVVTSNFAVGEGVITAKLPIGPGSAQASQKPPEQPLKIIVNSAGAIGTSYRVYIETFAQRPNTFSELSDMLIQLQYDPTRGLDGAYKPDNPVIIKPTGNVRWQHVVNAFNATVRARYSNVAFAQAGSGE